jgi:hypothetical protein
MAYARPLIDGKDVQAILGKDRLDSDDKNLIEDHLIPGVSKAIETYCGRNILDKAALTEYYSGDGDDTLQLKQWPINSVTSVHYRSGSGWDESSDWATALTANDDFYIESEKGQLIATVSAWSEAKKYYKVIYRAGWAEANIPEDIKTAAKIWTAILFQKVKSKLHGVDVHIVGEESFAYDKGKDGIPKEVKGLIDSYGRVY